MTPTETLSNKPCELTPVQGQNEDEPSKQWHRCIHCGELYPPGVTQVSTGKNYCSNPTIKNPVALPSYAARIRNYAKAWIKHKAAGNPNLPFEQILERFRHCSRCNCYHDLAGECGICGCYVNLLHNGKGANKLEWGTEECPHKPPLWLKQIQPPIEQK